MNTDFIDHYLKEHLSEKRRAHIEGVRETAIELAGRYGADTEKAETAALYHDMFKERDLDDLIDSLGISTYYKGKRNLAHSKVAAAVMEQKLGFTDRDLLNAVSYHTTGRPGMSKLEKIIFLADAMEPGREYPEVDELRRLTREDLDEACLFSLKRTIAFVRERGIDLDSDTADAAAYYEKLVKEKDMDSKSLALEAGKILDEKKGHDIMAIDISVKSSFADYLILASGNSIRQTGALADAVEDRFAELGHFPKGTEGKKESGWILQDYGDVIVNVLTDEMRERYNIESVWGDCELLDLGV